MKEILLKLISNSDDVSHKRVISILSFIAFLGLVIASCFHVKIDYALASMLIGLCLGQSGYTLISKKDTDNNSDQNT
jgi:divalent metal cation (Fe/Co/Zn/Cd) transporter